MKKLIIVCKLIENAITVPCAIMNTVVIISLLLLYSETLCLQPTVLQPPNYVKK